MIGVKHSSTGQGRIAPKAPMNFKNREEQGNPNESKEGGKDLLRPRKQRRCAAELWNEQVDAAANGAAEARLDDGGGAQLWGRREEEEGMKG